MPEESTFRKYACPKLKLSRLSLYNLFRILVQNLPAMEELNAKKHTPASTVWFYEIAELRKTWVSEKRNRAILREMTFANDCANCCFFAQNWCSKKEKFCVSFRKNCAKVLRMETLLFADDKTLQYSSENLIFQILSFHTL